MPPGERPKQQEGGQGDSFIRPIGEKLGFNPFLPEVRENPYPFYERLRSEDPVTEVLLEETGS